LAKLSLNDDGIVKNSSKGTHPTSKNNNGYTPPSLDTNINEDYDDDAVAQDMMGKASNVGRNTARSIKGAGNAAKRAGGNVKNAALNAKKKAKQTKKTAKEAKKTVQVGKKLAKAAIKALSSAVKAIISIIGPIGVAIVIFIILLVALFMVIDNAGVSGDRFIKSEAKTEDYNTLEYNEEGEPELTEITMSNKAIRAFYAYFAEQSVWINSEGVVHKEDGTTNKTGIKTDGPIQYRSEDYIDLFGDPDDEDSENVGDKYGRESSFYINPDALFVLDKYLHNEDYRFPEQIVKHVPYEKNNGYVEPELDTTPDTEDNKVDKGDVTDAQYKVAYNAANGISDFPATVGMCAAWVWGVYKKSGFEYTPQADAKDYWVVWQKYGDNTTKNIPVGAAIIGSGQESKTHGHIGIYIGDNKVAHNVGGVAIDSLEKWCNDNKIINPTVGGPGFIGWVWPGGKVLGTGTDCTVEIKSKGKSGLQAPYKLKQITNNDDELIVKSTKYKKTNKTVDGGTELWLTPTDEKIKGVHDYGFGSILNYEKYIEAEEKRGKLETIDVWDPNKEVPCEDKDGNKTTGYGGIESISVDQYEKNKDAYETPFKDLDKEYKWGKETSETYMISWAITPAGTVTNEIEFNWEDTGEVHTRPDNEVAKMEVTRLVKVEKTETVMLAPGDSITKPKEIDKDGKTIKEQTVTNNNTIQQQPSQPENLPGNQIGIPQLSIKSEPIPYTYTCYEELTYKESFNGVVSGTLWMIEPRYDDEVNLDGITGTRYYTDYLTYYNAYVPESVQGKLNLEDIKKRVHADSDEALLKILDNQKFNGDETLDVGFFDATGEFIGIGSIQAQFESGAKAGDANPGACGTDGTRMSWGIPQFPGTLCRGFTNYLKEKDPTMYNTYFKSFENNGEIPDSCFKNTNTNSAFAKAWKKCGEENKELFATYQISYAYSDDMVYVLKKLEKHSVLSQIDFERSFILQEFTYSVSCCAPGLAIDAFTKSGIRVTDSDEQIIVKVSQWICDNKADWWESKYWKGIDNRWNPKKKKSQVGIMLQYMKDYPSRGPYEFDREEKVFVGGGGGGTSNFSDDKLLRGVKRFFKNTSSYLNNFLFNEKYESVLDDKYWVEVKTSGIRDENQKNWIMSSLFAYEDGQPITDYEVDDDYFKLMFERLFSSQINTKYGGNTYGGITSTYFAGDFSTPVEEFEIVTEYSPETPMIKMTTEPNSEVKAVADGLVVETGYDADYGGYYVMIQHTKCVSIYGHLGEIEVRKDRKVKKDDIIGNSRANFYFGLKTKSKGVHIDPTDLLMGIGSGELMVPIQNVTPENLRISSWFGKRPQPGPGASTYHRGLDIPYSQGTKIVAADGGQVTAASYSGAYGNRVIIDHGNGMTTLYAHMYKIEVKEGDTVTRGQVIGEVGNTGNSYGAHLHFEVHIDGVHQDPAPYILGFKSKSNFN